LDIATTIAVLLAWYFILLRSDTKSYELVNNVVRIHPVFIVGVLVSFFIMSWRSTVFDYMSASILSVGETPPSRGFLALGERRLREKYVECFGCDLVSRAPNWIGAISMFIFSIAGFFLVFSGNK